MILGTLMHGIGSNWEIALPYNFAVLALAAYFVHILVRREKYPGPLELLAAFSIFGTSLASIRSETSRTVFFEVSCRFALATVGWGLCTLLVIQVATRHSTSQRVSLSSRVLGATVGFTLLLAPLFALGLWNASIVRLAFCLRYGCFWASLHLAKTKLFAFTSSVYGPITVVVYLVFRTYPELWLRTPWKFFQHEENFRIDLAGQYMVPKIANMRCDTCHRVYW